MLRTPSLARTLSRARFASAGADASAGGANAGTTTRGNFASERKTVTFARRWGRIFKLTVLPSYINLQLEPCVKDFATKPEAMENTIGRE